METIPRIELPPGSMGPQAAAWAPSGSPVTAPELLSIAPVRTALHTWRSARGPMATVICKATYRLAPTESPLASEQEYPNEDDDHWNDDPARSLHAPSDLVPIKPRAEVLVVGSAFAGSSAKRKLVARIVVGDVDKAIQVAGDRHYGGDGALTEPTPFAKMPLRYERASGGPGTTNPVGMSWDHVDSRGRTKLPNILPVDFEPGPERGPIDSVGFGPIGRTWPLRAARLDAAGERWLRPSHQDEPMPDAFDASFFLSAPHDQQTQELRANERIVLEHLFRDRTRLVTSLPGIEPRVFVDRGAGAPHELAMRGDTLWIDTERAIATLVWRGQVPLFPDMPRAVVVASSMIGQRLVWSEVEPLLGRPVLGTAAAMRLERGPRPSSTGSTSAPPSVPRPIEPSQRPETLDDDDVIEPMTSPDEHTSVGPAPVPAALPFTRPSKPPRPATPLGSTIETVLEDEDLLPAAARRGGSPAWLPEARPPIPPTPPLRSPGDTRKSVAPPREVARIPSPPPPAPAFGAPPAEAPSMGSQSAPSAGPWREPAGASPWAASTAAGPAWSRPPVQPPPPVMGDGAPGFADVAPAAMRAEATPLQPTFAAANGAREVSSPPRPMAASSPEFSVAPVNALAASNAAAQEPTRPRPVSRGEPAAARPETEARGTTFVDLIWFDPSTAGRVRASPAFKDALSTTGATWRKAGDEARAKDAAELRDRRDVMRVLTGGAAIEAERAREALEASFTDPVEFSYPIVLLSGELAVSFDEQALLRVSLQCGATLAGNDKRLRDALAVATEGTRAEPQPTPEGYAALLRHLQEAFGGGRGGPSVLESAATRIALEDRLYKKKTLLGARRLRAELASASLPLPVYLPESLENALPLMARLRVRILGELRHQEDHTEAHPLALVALAIGRILKGG